MHWPRKHYKGLREWDKTYVLYREIITNTLKGKYTLSTYHHKVRYAHRSIRKCRVKKSVWSACYRINEDESFTRIGWHWEGRCPNKEGRNE